MTTPNRFTLMLYVHPEKGLGVHPCMPHCGFMESILAAECTRIVGVTAEGELTLLKEHSQPVIDLILRSVLTP